MHLSFRHLLLDIYIPAEQCELVSAPAQRYVEVAGYFLPMDIRFGIENGVWVAGRRCNDLPLLTISLRNVWTMRKRRGLILGFGGEPSLFLQLDLPP